jgi:hypothetical protein
MGTGNWCGGIGSDDARKVAAGRIVVMEESRHKKSLENRRKIKEAQYPGARAWYRREREPGSDDGDGDDHYDGRDHAFKHYFSLEPTQFVCLLRDPIREGLESRATALLACELLEHAHH